MASAIPAKLRDAQIGQFARRAAQLEKFKPIITYWLRFYMTQKIISKGLHLADQECTAYTTDLMEKLEQTKAEHPTEDALIDEVAAYAYCEQFALATFTKGDNDIRSNKVTEATADTLMAASTFLELLSVWKNPPEPEVKSKMTYAKFHALRIVKAIKAGEDPNLSNPKQETPPAELQPLDPHDSEVQNISGQDGQANTQAPYQPYVESAPSTSQPSPAFTPSRPQLSPPPTAPSPQQGAPQPPSQMFSPHQDVSPISPVDTSRQNSVTSIGGGYFPRTSVPTFTADNVPAGMPTAPSVEMDVDATANPYAPPLSPSIPSPQPSIQPIQSMPHTPGQPTGFPTSQPPAQQFTQPPFQQTSPQFPGPPVPPPQQYSYPPQHHQPPTAPPPQTFTPSIPSIPHPQPAIPQGPLRRDEEAISDAQKHAKWAISALNFEDVDTAVKELRIALRTLGAG
ncbi:DUF605-domain-containing protein [Sporormia fimetaria CBS 119925]|uniref:DUF605-domain-containing protein n=1 Tax=Sporormia fimetaria CBS 119925 TaxID=1340428 RepID=A0A6A6VLD6_9PLEO|nr:DUF605-domain-containing protein [Sporormia fimetaria CBS 119925]